MITTDCHLNKTKLFKWYLMAVFAGICIIENLMFNQKEGNNVLDLFSIATKFSDCCFWKHLL